MKLLLIFTAVMLLVSCSGKTALKATSSTDAKDISFSDHTGSSFNDAVVVKGVSNLKDGLAAEYHYISSLHGKRGDDWFLLGQTLIHEHNKLVDVIEIELKNSADRRIFFFDATSMVTNE